MIQNAFDGTIASQGKLDLSFWQAHLDELLENMKAHGYCGHYCKKVYYHARRIAVLSQEIRWDSYEEIWNWYSSQVHGKGYLRDVRAVLGILMEYQLYGILPNNRMTQNPLCPRKNCYSMLVPKFKTLVDYVYEVEKRRGLKPSTCKCTKTKASSFLYSLQQRGAENLSDVTEDDVLAFFYKDGTHLRGQSTASRISLFFRTCAPIIPDECKRIELCIPKFHSSVASQSFL